MRRRRPPPPPPCAPAPSHATPWQHPPTCRPCRWQLQARAPACCWRRQTACCPQHCRRCWRQQLCCCPPWLWQPLRRLLRRLWLANLRRGVPGWSAQSAAQGGSVGGNGSSHASAWHAARRHAGLEAGSTTNPRRCSQPGSHAGCQSPGCTPISAVPSVAAGCRHITSPASPRPAASPPPLHGHTRHLPGSHPAHLLRRRHVQAEVAELLVAGAGVAAGGADDVGAQSAAKHAVRDAVCCKGGKGAGAEEPARWERWERGMRSVFRAQGPLPWHLGSPETPAPLRERQLAAPQCRGTTGPRPAALAARRSAAAARRRTCAGSGGSHHLQHEAEELVSVLLLVASHAAA